MKTILVLVDFSYRSEEAAEFAWTLAIKSRSEILLFNSFYYVPQPENADAGIFDTKMKSYSAFEKESLEQLKLFSERLITKFNDAGEVQLPKFRLENGMGHLADNVLELLEREKLWMIIMGGKRKESFFERFIFGHDTSEVIDKATCPVLLIHKRVDFNNIKRIAFAVDSIKTINLKVLGFLVEFAIPFDAEIFVAHVSEKTETEEEREELQRDFIKERKKFHYNEITFYDIQGYDVTKTLLEFERSADLNLIAVIHNKYSLFEGLFHNSVTEKLMDYQDVPLLVFPEGYEP